jgi:hypothetical protein
MSGPDFSQFKEKDKNAPAKKKILPIANRWWLADAKDLPQAVMQQCAAIIEADRGRIESYNTNAKLYGTFTPTFWNGYQLSSTGRAAGPVRDRLTYNIIQSCIDATHAKIIKNKPKPMFLTQAGNSKQQNRAKKLDAYMYGLFYGNGAYIKGPKAAKDSLIQGDGITHVFNDDGKVGYERVFGHELLVDYLESHYGPESTLSLHRIKNIDRTVLGELHPEKAEAIAIMPSTATFISASQRSVSDQVTVVESWRLPYGRNSGRHTIVTGDVTLLDDDYDDSFFPFAVMPFNPRQYGFFSQGMCEQLIPTQVEINRTLISIQRSLYMGGTHKIMLKHGSKVVKSHFDNIVGTIIEYSGDVAPQYVVPQLVQPEIYTHLNAMKNDGYQLVGVNQMQASGLKSPGVNSGRAMRTEQNISTERFEAMDQSYAQYYMDLSKISISVQRQIAKDGIDPEVKVPGKRFIEKIKWSEVSLNDDEFVMQMYPVSKLPQDPEGRLSTIQEMAQAGWIDAATARRLMDFPDLDAEETLANAQRDYLGKILDGIVDDGKPAIPESDDNLQMAKKLVLEYISLGKLNNLKEDRLEMLRTFSQKVDLLATPPQPVAPPGGPAPALPTATPQSDLLPNINGAQAS